MRPLTEDETRLVFEKLHKYLGKSIKSLVERTDEPYCFRLQRNRVFYVSEKLMRRATNVRRESGEGRARSCVGGRRLTGNFGGPGAFLAALTAFFPDALLFQIARDKLVALGTCVGKFTHSGKFHLTIGALDILAQYAKYKVIRAGGSGRVVLDVESVNFEECWSSVHALCPYLYKNHDGQRMFIKTSVFKLRHLSCGDPAFAADT